jgi:ACS family tartrate transporter-like MFS transporter
MLTSLMSSGAKPCSRTKSSVQCVWPIVVDWTGISFCSRSTMCQVLPPGWNDWSFYSVRFLLGLAEAGFYPGMILYLTWWFPSFYRARMMAIFYSSNTISSILGPPIGGLLLHLDGLLGLHGWQWLFIVEALPPVVSGVITWHLLTDRPTDATWLRPDQRTWLAERLDSERAQREAVRKFTLGQMFADPKMWLLTAAYFGQQVANYGIIIFLPLIVAGLGFSTNSIGLVSGAPYLFALVVMIFWGLHSDRTGERVGHVAAAWLQVAAGLAACAIIGIGHPFITMVALTFAIIGSQCVAPVFWSIPNALLTGTAAAGGIAMINAVANLGGWIGPWMFGLVKDASGSDNIGLLCLSVAPVVSCVLLYLAGHDRRMERIMSSPS